MSETVRRREWYKNNRWPEPRRETHRDVQGDPYYVSVHMPGEQTGDITEEQQN